MQTFIVSRCLETVQQIVTPLHLNTNSHIYGQGDVNGFGKNGQIAECNVDTIRDIK